jgi:hypothetical protein
MLRPSLSGVQVSLRLVAVVTSAKRAVFPVAVLAAAISALVTGCGSSGSSAAATSTATVAASPTPSAVISGSVGSASAQAASPSASASLAVSATASFGAAAGSVVYFAEGGGDVNVPGAYKPTCATGCGLSGDGTTELYNMTWSAWNGTDAVGTGTEKIDDCAPNCATGTLHSVAVAVTFSKPVQVCVGGVAKRYWTQVAFAWPQGLPAALSGANAPLNPVDYANITPSAC